MPQQELWQRIQSCLKSKTNDRLYSTWLAPASLESIESTAVGRILRIGVPSTIYRDYIFSNFMPTLEEAIGTAVERPFQIEITVGNPLEGLVGTANPVSEPLSLAAFQPPPIGVSPSPVVSGFQNPRVSLDDHGYGRRDILNPDYTFSSFVVGPGNQFAHAACWSVADNPGKTYNPLFIYGPSGMGKTHLLNAVGNHIRGKFPTLRISYLSAERFLSDVVTSLRHGQMEKFRKRYREQCDVLLIDDIHIIAGKSSTQEEFFYTFNAFHEAGKQVVVSSDKLPRDIEGLEERIKTRLEWGLTADIQAPDLETRMAILRYKSEKSNLFLPDDVCAFIAQISKTSIRELEGNLTKLKVYAELREINITLELAHEIFSSAMQRQSKGITFETIQKAISDYYKIQIRDLKSETRVKSVARPRQVAMYFSRKLLAAGFADIGKQFGGRDHTTVMHGVSSVTELIEKNNEFKSELDRLEGIIHNS